MRVWIMRMLAVLMILLAGAAAGAAEPSDTAVIAALNKFADVLESGDARALERMIYVDTLAQERTRTVLAQLVIAEKALERTALGRFGEDGKRFRCGFDLIATAADRKALSSAKLTYEEGGRVALVEKAGEASAMSLKRSLGGQWQVVLETVDDTDKEERNEPPRPFPPFGRSRWEAVRAANLVKLKAFADAFDQTRARIESGNLPSAAAAQGELSAKLVIANAEAIKAKAAAFERRIPR